ISIILVVFYQGVEYVMAKMVVDDTDAQLFLQFAKQIPASLDRENSISYYFIMDNVSIHTSKLLSYFLRTHTRHRYSVKRKPGLTADQAIECISICKYIKFDGSEPMKSGKLSINIPHCQLNILILNSIICLDETEIINRSLAREIGEYDIEYAQTLCKEFMSNCISAYNTVNKKLYRKCCGDCGYLEDSSISEDLSYYAGTKLYSHFGTRRLQRLLIKSSWKLYYTGIDQYAVD
ncbi:hypothetical protein PHYBLDRAFT_73803, partial [Phycomyces blakesleeanus NRRL 1555(-)]